MTTTSELRERAVQVAGSLEPETMIGEQAAAAVQDLATAEKAIASTLLFTALRVARSSAWQGRGFASAADWLADQLGISVREAAAHLGTAKKADRLPKTKKAMKKGDLSPDQAGAVADGADADPQAEDDLLDSAARDTNKALKDKAAKAKAAATDSATRERRIRSRRSLRRGTDAEGAFWMRLYGPGVDAAAFEALLRPFEELLFRHGRSTGARDTFENRSYDAFLAMLAHHTHLATRPTNGSGADDPAGSGGTAGSDDTAGAEGTAGSGGPAGSGGSAGPAPAPGPGDEPGRDAAPVPGRDADIDRGRDVGADPGAPSSASSTASAPSGPPGSHAAPAGPPDRSSAGSSSPPTWRPPCDPDRSVPLPAKLPGGNNVKVIVLVDHRALLRGHTLPGETSEIAGIGPVSITAVRDILRNDPFLAVVVRKGRDVVNVAHHGRGLNAHQRTAIEAGGIRCSNRACNQTTAIEIDHRIGYAVHDETKLDNQDPLCPACHRLKTHHGHHLEPGTGPRRLLPPRHPDTPLTTRPSEQAGAEPAAGHADDRPAYDTTRPPSSSHRPRVEQPTLC